VRVWQQQRRNECKRQLLKEPAFRCQRPGIGFDGVVYIVCELGPGDVQLMAKVRIAKDISQHQEDYHADCDPVCFKWFKCSCTLAPKLVGTVKISFSPFLILTECLWHLMLHDHRASIPYELRECARCTIRHREFMTTPEPVASMVFSISSSFGLSHWVFLLTGGFGGARFSRAELPRAAIPSTTIAARPTHDRLPLLYNFAKTCTCRSAL
jgi:hypothetical protein